MAETSVDFDVEGNLGAVERTVSSLRREGQHAGAVTLVRGFSTTVEDLWDAVTNAGRLARWFVPVSGDFEPGGRYQLEGNAGGAITVCERLSHFALTWEFGEDVSWVVVRIASDGSGCRLSLTHIALLSEHLDEYGPGATGVGWDLALLALALHVARPDEPKPDEAAFVASGAGKSFIAGSSEAWAQAAIAAGADLEAATAAAARTTAFYTGE